MKFYQLGFRYLQRKKGKTILLLIVLILVNSMILGTSMILRTTNESKQAMQEKTNSKIVAEITSKDSKITENEVNKIETLEAEFEKLCVYSKRPEKLDVLETSLQKIFGNDVELSTSDTLYQQMSAPLEQISKVANLMLVLTLVTGTVVVSLLLCMWMRTRQKEVAIFMSLGKTKSEIFLQTLLEAGSVFTLSVLGATAIGKLFSGVLQNVITGSETVTENLKVVLQIQDIGMLCEEVKQERRISVIINAFHEMIVIRIENSCMPIKWKNGMPVSEKGKNRGIGLMNVRRAIEKYDGDMKLENEKGMFIVDIFLNS